MSPLPSKHVSLALSLLCSPALGACSDALVLKTEGASGTLVEETVGGAATPVPGDAGPGGLLPEVARAALLTGGVRGDVSVIAGEWVGETIGFAFESGATTLALDIALGGGGGNLKFGRGNGPPPPSDAIEAYPPEWYARGSFSSDPFDGVYEGFAYPLRVVAVAPSFERIGSTTPVTLRANKRDLYADWCALQIPRPSPTSGALACSIPGNAHDVEDDECFRRFLASRAGRSADDAVIADAGPEFECRLSDVAAEERQCNIYDDREYVARHGVGSEMQLLGTVPCAQHATCHYACPVCDPSGCPVIDDQDIHLDLALDDGALIGWLRMTFGWFGYGSSADYPQPNLAPTTVRVRFERRLALPR